MKMLDEILFKYLNNITSAKCMIFESIVDDEKVNTLQRQICRKFVETLKPNRIVFHQAVMTNIIPENECIEIVSIGGNKFYRFIDLCVVLKNLSHLKKLSVCD
eukprot:405756_1